ncbi:hypothetical protein I862_05410 [endosymbiont of Acanthamoeba sp. UWC8]|nr:hypothetical protein I862_05410 [endosymbiont of Acanthamoeba sp. UWC8]
MSSYPTISPLPIKITGGIFSAALSMRLPSPGVTRDHCSIKPGLSSESF